jgi:hypothetical protein
MRHKTVDVSTAKPVEGSLELTEFTEELIRVRAYRFFEERGYEDGHDLEDWLRAEAEILGKKTAAAAAETKGMKGGSRAAVA